MNKYRILLVDDEERLVQCLELVLSLEGHNVTTAESGESAYRMIKELYENGETIDLLITDIWMPGMSGLMLLDKLSQLNIKLTVLGITGFTEADTAKELTRKGLVGLISKPFKPEELLHRINEIMNSKNVVES